MKQGPAQSSVLVTKMTTEPPRSLPFALPSPDEARRRLREGEFPWEPHTLFAPMEGVTHPIFRELIAAGGGVGVLCTEFVRVTSIPLSKKTLAKHVVRPSQGALSVQVMGNDLVQMAEATELVTAAGADIVDINLGCPAPKAVRKGVGSALLKDRALLRQVVAAMRERTHLPLSAKMRAGFDHVQAAVDIARTLEDVGVDFITVHPRRRVDFYEGRADWRIIRSIVEAVQVPVVGNGDIWSVADALRIRKETGCHAVMMGRPILRNPWLFQQLAAVDRGERPLAPQGADVLAYYEQLASVLVAGGISRNVAGLLKEQLRYLGRAVPDGGEFLREVCRAPTVEAIFSCLREKVAARSAEQLDLGVDLLDTSAHGVELGAALRAPAKEILASGLALLF